MNQQEENEFDHSPITREEFGPELSPQEREVFARGLGALNDGGIPYLVGGAFAKHAYTNVWRRTKDLDIYVRPEDVRQALELLESAGFTTEIPFRQWLAKAHWEPHFIDIIFGTGHGQLRVDDGWFERSKRATLAGLEVQLAPREELLASMLYVMERDRFDGPEVNHLILQSENLDWQHVVTLLGKHRLLLLVHLLHFAFVYPGRASRLPQELMAELFADARAAWQQISNPKAFRGSLLDPFSYVVDVEDWGYEDRRDLSPLVDEKGTPVDEEE